MSKRKAGGSKLNPIDMTEDDESESQDKHAQKEEPNREDHPLVLGKGYKICYWTPGTVCGQQMTHTIITAVDKRQSSPVRVDNYHDFSFFCISEFQVTHPYKDLHWHKLEEYKLISDSDIEEQVPRPNRHQAMLRRIAAQCPEYTSCLPLK